MSATPAGLPVRLTGMAYGRRVEVEGPDVWAAELAARMPPGWVPDPDGPAGSVGLVERRCALVPLDDGTWVAQADGVTVASAPAPEALLETVSGECELWVAEHAEGLIFVHAGAVAVDGRVLVLPGRTRAGKSTLTAALVRAGAQYLSDEYAVIDPQGRVHAYPRPLSMRAADGGDARRVPVQELGGEVGSAGRIGLVAALRFDDAGWVVRAMSPAESVLALVDNTIAAQTRPVEMMDHLQAAMGLAGGVTARGVTGSRGEATEAAGKLLEMLKGS